MDRYKKRIALVEKELKKRGLESFLVTNETNVSYLSGFEGADSTLLFTPGRHYFITDSRYAEEARNTLAGFDIKLVSLSNYEVIKDIAEKKRLKNMGFESMSLMYEVAVRLRDVIKKVKILPIRNMVENFRSIKDAGEIALIRKSVNLTKKVLTKAMGMIKPGLSERSLSDMIELEFIKEGARISFDPIVAADRNSSKPHARPTSARIRNNSFVMIDMGCSLGGYNSDITRMVFLGKVKDKLKKIYRIISDAQKTAIDMIRPGVKISKVDEAARCYIAKEGFGRYFGHSLGHGIGLEVHEEPTISGLNKNLISAGMVFTVEPAIYIPGLGGARLEDMVLVTDNGCEILTR